MTTINVETIVVEIARLDVQRGDIVMVSPREKRAEPQVQELMKSLDALSRRTGIHFVYKDPDIDLTIVAKA